jgi:hypothetical protein
MSWRAASNARRAFCLSRHGGFHPGSLSVGTAWNAVFLLLLLLADSLRAGPPLQTDDPGTPGPNHWEINAFTVMEKRRDVWKWTPFLEINYGLGERIQLKLEPSYVVLDEPGQRARSGPGNILLGVKWRFLDEQPHRFAMSIYPQIDLNPPGTSDRRGLVANGANFILPAEIEHTFGKTRIFGEVGYVWREHRRDGWIYGLGFEHPTEGVFQWTGEIRGSSEGDLSDSEVVFNAGFRARLADHVSLFVSGARTLREAPAEPTGVFSYLGLQFTF